MLPNLKLLRREYGISQQKLADALGISQQSINQYENHCVEPDIDTLSQMANYFETSIDYIVGRSNDRRRMSDGEAFYLNSEELKIITGYRVLSLKERQCVHQVIDTFAERG